MLQYSDKRIEGYGEIEESRALSKLAADIAAALDETCGHCAHCNDPLFESRYDEYPRCPDSGERYCCDECKRESEQQHADEMDTRDATNQWLSGGGL